jgi:hypothetical protein
MKQFGIILVVIGFFIIALSQLAHVMCKLAPDAYPTEVCHE